MSFVPSSLRAFLGPNATNVTEDALKKLLALPESDELDFKQQPYGPREEDRRELATDVSSFANHKGGLIIIGIAESGNGQPYRLVPLLSDSLDSEGLRIQQIVTTWVVPAIPGLQVVPIRGETGGYLLISIPRSVRQPHAVHFKDDLRYPIRAGSGKRYLSESEVADKYRNRFDEASGQVDKLLERHDSLSEKINRPLETWLVASLQPDVRGSVPYSRQFAASLGGWIGPRLDSFPGLHNSLTRSVSLYVRGGFRSYRFSDKEPDPYIQFGSLHRDGGGSVAHGWNRPDDESPQLKIFPEDLVSAIINSLNLLASWATEHAGVDGDAAVVAQIHSAFGGSMLWHDNFPLVGAIPGTSPLNGSTSIADFTVNLISIVEDGRDLLHAARGLSEDLLSVFEFIEPSQIDREGSLRIRYFSKSRHDRLRRWAGEHGTTITEESLDL